MEFKQLQSFVEVVRNLSFTKASQELYISQPTVSMHIHQLETELGVRLIIRTTKSLEVTPVGKQLYEYAVNILAMRDRMIANCSVQDRHILSLGASTIPSAYLLPKILPSFAAKYPESYFVIHQSDSTGVMDGLLEGIYDLGIIGMKPASDALAWEHLCDDRIILIAPVNEHFLALKESDANAFQILQNEPLILREAGSGSGKKADEILLSAGISEDQLQITARANDQEAIKNMVQVQIYTKKMDHILKYTGCVVHFLISFYFCSIFVLKLNQSSPCVICFFAFFGEYGLVALLSGFGVKHCPRPVGLAVVFELQSFTAYQYFGRSYESAQSILIVLKQTGIHCIRRVAGHYQQHRDESFIAAGLFNSISQVLEYQALVKCAKGCGQLAEIIRRADYQSVRLTNGVQHGSKPILYDAVPFEFFFFAAETRDAAGILFQTIKVELLHFCACLFCTFYGFIYQRIRVPALPGSCVYCHYPLAHVVTYSMSRSSKL